MLRPLALTAALLAFAGTHLVAHAAAPAKQTKKSTKAEKAKAEQAAPPEDLDVDVSPNQLDIASRVITGVADCEFSQTIRVEPRQNRPGHFHVGFKNVTYTMVPEETTTGAVRLHDPKHGVVWLQIPSKSMLMNAKIGQRLVDSCTLQEQRLTVAAAAKAMQGGNAASAAQAGGSLGFGTSTSTAIANATPQPGSAAAAQLAKAAAPIAVTLPVTAQAAFAPVPAALPALPAAQPTLAATPAPDLVPNGVAAQPMRVADNTPIASQTAADAASPPATDAAAATPPASPLPAVR